MAKTLSVVIPYYREKETGMLPLLSSLNNQLGVDYGKIEVILVNDGNRNVLSEGFLSLFQNLRARVIYLDENLGPGMARQAGLDNAAGEYVMFCDADDIIHSVGVLGAFLQEIERGRPDLITSAWLEELYVPDTGQYIYLTHEDENTWLHGKVFRRLFLQARNIRFHKTLRVHEDSYFLSIVMAHTNNAVKSPVTSYVWKWGDGSITRRNGGVYTFESVPEFLRAIDLSFREVERINPAQMQYKTVQLIIYQYFVTHRPDWQTAAHAEYLEKAEGIFREMIGPYIKYFESAPIGFINQVYLEERVKYSTGIENELFGVWLDRMLGK